MKERKRPEAERRKKETAGQDGARVMSKEEFLAELEACLSDLSKEEREEALAYYQDYLEEAGDEPQVIERLGTPRQVAEGIRMGLEQDVDAGEFTESGYRDERLEEAAKIPDRYTVLMKKEAAQESKKTSEEHRAEEETEKAKGTAWNRARFEAFGRQARQTWEEAKQDGFGKRAKQAWDDARTGEWGTQAENAWEEVKSRAARSGKDSEKAAQTTAVRKKSNHGILFLILLLFFGIPAAGVLLGTGFSFVAALFGALFGIFCGLFGLAVTACAAAIGAVSAGAAMIGAGIANLVSLPMAFVMIGGGFLMLAVGMLCFLLMKWGFGTVIPWAFRTAWSAVSCAAGWLRDKVRQMFGKGGEAQ